jgi:hypothetical protein
MRAEVYVGIMLRVGVSFRVYQRYVSSYKGLDAIHKVRHIEQVYVIK